MKILAFSDIHNDIIHLKEAYRKFKEEKPEIVICAGDIFEFWNFSPKIKDLLEKFDTKLLLIHGNHEDLKLINKLCNENIINLHNKIFNVKNFTFFGYGGGGFSQEDKKLENDINKIKNRLNNWVFITHAPPFNTNLDLVYDHHVGSKSIRKIIEKFDPLLNICGHLHENFYIKDKINKTEIINPGPSGSVINI
ncbi:MAG: metallophosphoesterase [Nanoarchaeota archaeon]